METGAGSRAGFTAEPRSLNTAAAPRTSAFLSGAPGLGAGRHLAPLPISHLRFSLPAPLSTRPNKGHPRMAASALHLHGLTTHSVLWRRPRVLGEKLSGLPWAGRGGLWSVAGRVGSRGRERGPSLAVIGTAPWEGCAGMGERSGTFSRFRVAVASFLVHVGQEVCLIEEWVWDCQVLICLLSPPSTINNKKNRKASILVFSKLIIFKKFT